jgi:hypothetical protein
MFSMARFNKYLSDVAEGALEGALGELQMCKSAVF